jgi:hypothetical protein
LSEANSAADVFIVAAVKSSCVVASYDNNDFF